MSVTICLLCGTKRMECCGDSSCPCVGGAGYGAFKEVMVPGLVFSDSIGRLWVTERCGHRYFYGIKHGCKLSTIRRRLAARRRRRPLTGTLHLMRTGPGTVRRLEAVA